MSGLGVKYFPLRRAGAAERIARTHVPDGGSDRTGWQYLIEVLHQARKKRGMGIARGNRVNQLLTRDGAAPGVPAGGDAQSLTS